MAGQLKDLTEEQRKAEEARTQNMVNYANLLGPDSQGMGRDRQAAEANSAFKPDGFVVQGALKLKDAIVQIKETLEFIRDHGLGTYLNPFSKESMDRQKNDFEESMKKINEAKDAGKPPEERARLQALRQQAIDEANRKQEESARPAQQQLQDRMQHLRKLNMAPQYFSSGGGTDITADWPKSSNIEDRRGEGGDNDAKNTCRKTPPN